MLQLGGHTLIYVDDERNAEVDIFTPMAEADGTAIGSYGDLITYLSSDVVFANLLELDAVSIAGFPTRVFEGTAESPDRAFITEIAAASNDQLGWFPPARMRLWVIDHPSGAVIISAESLENPWSVQRCRAPSNRGPEHHRVRLTSGWFLELAPHRPKIWETLSKERALEIVHP